MLKLNETWSVDCHENHKNYCHQMSHFKAKMHQIRFRLGFRPRPGGGSLQCAQTLARLSRLNCNGRERRGRERRGGMYGERG